MNSEKENWAGIIRAVKSPVGFFALVVLCIEAVLALVSLQVEKTTAVTVIYVMAGVLVLVVVSVLIIAIRTSAPPSVVQGVFVDRRRPENKSILRPGGQRSTDPQSFAHLSDYEVLQLKISDYAEKHRSTQIVLEKGERIIKKGDPADHLFLLQEGNLVIDDETGRPREEKELKYPGSIVGELAVVGSNRRRTASVYVYSSHARLVKMSRDAVKDLAAYDKQFQKALSYLVKLHASRLEKVAIYCGPGVEINTEECTVLMGDIHGYTRLSEAVTDEMACPFRFKFTDQSEKAAAENLGTFEDQGDGYKVIFRGEGHVDRAMRCAIEMRRRYRQLVDEFAQYDGTFKDAGLGMGLSSDDFTVITKPDGMQKILGHSINVAAALCKARGVPSETKIYCTEEIIKRVDRSLWLLEGPVVCILDKLGTPPHVYTLLDRIGSEKRPATARARTGADVSKLTRST